VGEGDEALVEHGDAAKRRHSRIGAQQDLSRARADLEHAGLGGPDPEIVIRLEVIEQELTVLRRQAGSRSRKRDERRLIDLLLSERLLLEQLGFATYADYTTWRDGYVRDDLTDLAYLEFARMELESAQERLDAIEAGALDPATDSSGSSGTGGLEPYLVVPAREVEELTPTSTEPRGAALEAWTAEPAAETSITLPDDAPEEATRSGDGAAGLPHLGTTDMDNLDLPYWDETA